MRQYIDPDKTKTFKEKTVKVQELINNRFSLRYNHCNNIVINKYQHPFE